MSVHKKDRKYQENWRSTAKVSNAFKKRNTKETSLLNITIAGVQNSENRLLGILFYYNAKRERHFAIVMYISLAVSSRE